MSEPARTVLGMEPHLEAPNKACASWLIEPSGMLNQAAPGVPLDVAVADFISTTVDAAMRRRHPPPQRYLYVHDFRFVSTVEGGARDRLIAFGRRTTSAEVERIFLLPPSGAIWRTAASAAILALRLGGIRMELADSLAEVVRAHGISPATRA